MTEPTPARPHVPVRLGDAAARRWLLPADRGHRSHLWRRRAELLVSRTTSTSSGRASRFRRRWSPRPSRRATGTARSRTRCRTSCSRAARCRGSASSTRGTDPATDDRCPGDPPAPNGPVPWVALLVFEEGEYTLLRGIPLQQAVPADVFARLGSPANITCDAVEADQELVEAIMPSLEELQLLAHVRWVNVEDRELNTAGGDGYYAVVVANRLPSPGAQCRASWSRSRSARIWCRRTRRRWPRTRRATKRRSRNSRRPLRSRRAEPRPMSRASGRARSRGRRQLPSPIFTRRASAGAHVLTDRSTPPIFHVGAAQKVRLVALTSWQFTCEGPGTFRELMQNLDVAMFGNGRRRRAPGADRHRPPADASSRIDSARASRSGTAARWSPTT